MMRYAADALRDAARALLAAARMDEPFARDVADVLVEVVAGHAERGGRLVGRECQPERGTLAH